MNIKFNTLWLISSLSLFTFLLPLATSANPIKQINAEFLKLVSLHDEKSVQYIAASQSQGIALLDENRTPVARIERAVEYLDYRVLPKEANKGVITTLDINSGELILIEVDHQQQQLEIRQTLKLENTAIDAVCLSSASYGIDVFTVDVLGQVVQYNAYQSNNHTWQFNEVTRFPVGPNVKSCAVDEKTQSLFITEENIGVWRYSTNPEHEQVRELFQLSKGLEVEYVDTTVFGDIAVVSPDVNAVWLLEQKGQKFMRVKLPERVSPKTVQLTRLGDSLVFNIYDDNNEQMLSKTIRDVKKANHALVHAVERLSPYAQTKAVKSYGDAADDPAIWINKQIPKASLVYATNKKYGLNVYDLSGALVTSLPVGRINNVDIRYDVTVNGKKMDIAAASNRTTKSISVFLIDKTTGLPTHLTDIKTDLADPYGFCLSQNNNQISAWVNDTDGRFQRYDFELNSKELSAEKTLEWTVPSQPEGCVSDDATQRLFYGEEATGVWLKQINGNTADKLITGLNEDIAADIEGMSLYQLGGKNYLVVSSQGNNRYAVYAVDNNHQFLGAFEIGANWQKMIDGASETDGLAVTSHFLGEQLPDGLMVVQDGRNVMPRAAQNFKLVSGTLLRDWITKKLNSIK